MVRGCRYGIVANKSAGKTTLLRSIAGYMIEGFPTKEELRTTFVETDISPEQTKMNVVEFVVDTLKHIRTLTLEEVSKTLTEMGYDYIHSTTTTHTNEHTNTRTNTHTHTGSTMSCNKEPSRD